MSLKNLLLLCSIGLLFSCQEPKEEEKAIDKDPVDYVNPFIGTGGHGHTFPGATVPFGMVQLSPDTRLEGWDGCSGYHYTDSIVYGFSHTHLSGTGVADYCDILFKPCIGTPNFDNGYENSPEAGYSSYFSKESEVATPGYYKMKMEEGIEVELTATERVGFHKYTFKNADNPHVILDLTHRDKLLGADMQILDDHTIQGYRRSASWAQDQHVFFVATFDHPIKKHETYYSTSAIDADSTAMVMAKAWFEFDLKDGESLQMKVAISPVDNQGASQNLEAEIADWDFDKVKNGAREKWAKELNKIQVEGNNEEDKAIFYSALYHTMIAPNLFSDVDGRYRKALPKDEEARINFEPIGQLPEGQEQYTIFSLWDTYRATHPLYTIIDEKRTNAYINTFLRQYQDGGQLPVWELACNYTGCMIGYHAVPVIADAYTKGIRGYDAEMALKAMRHSAEMGNLGLSSQVKYGFIPTGDEPESVSKTLEYAYDDWCIATMAKQLGDEEAFATYNERAQYYKNLYNSEEKFLMGRSNGGWYGPFRPEEVNFNYTEANGWQYSLAVPQDISGLMQLMGGKSEMIRHLDELFSTNSETSGRHQADITGLIGQYAHGNEPSHHMAYLYNYAGQPWKTQAMVHRIMQEMYQNAPDGLSGNEDCGQMSAWYVFSAMGFYPVCPGSDQYVIGSPRFESVKIQLENGKTFEITAKGAGNKSPYLQSVKLNGDAYSKSYITHADILKGGKLEFEVGSAANKNWGTAEEDLPHSSIEEAPISIAPALNANSRTFEDSLVVHISSPEEGVTTYVAVAPVNGPKPEMAQTDLDKVVLTKSARIYSWTVNKDNVASKEVYGDFHKIQGGRSINLGTEYANQYSAGGDKALIDMLKGSAEFRTGSWQGYEGVNLEAVVDLGVSLPVNKVSLGCLQDIKSWIWFPTSVEIYLSDDGKKFLKAAEVVNDFPDSEYGSHLKSFSASFRGKKARYIKVIGHNYGRCPDWHLGAGGTAWLFVDEITIE